MHIIDDVPFPQNIAWFVCTFSWFDFVIQSTWYVFRRRKQFFAAPPTVWTVEVVCDQCVCPNQQVRNLFIRMVGVPWNCIRHSGQNKFNHTNWRLIVPYFVEKHQEHHTETCHVHSVQCVSDSFKLYIIFGSTWLKDSFAFHGRQMFRFAGFFFDLFFMQKDYHLDVVLWELVAMFSFLVLKCGNEFTTISCIKLHTPLCIWIESNRKKIERGKFSG